MSGPPHGDPVPRTAEGRAALRAIQADPARAVVAFDFDGTLSPIVDDPAEARGHPGAADALARLAQHVGRVAVITGRPAATAVSLAGLDRDARLAGLRVLGGYGRERWDGATRQVTAPPVDPAVDDARRALPDVLREAGVDAYLEDKGAAIAVHTRRLPDPAAGLDRLRGPVTELAERLGLALEPGRNVLELRPRGFDKGGALRGLVADSETSAVVFVGDDLGDLPAFDAVVQMRGSGVPGLCVCSGSAEVPQLAERADLVVDGPDGVVAWIDGLVATFGDPAGPPAGAVSS